MSLQLLRRSVLPRRGFAALALLAMALKAVIPVGFMVAAVDGHAQLVLCPAGIHLAAGQVALGAAHAMPGMDMAHATHAAHAGSHAAADCPFSLASTAGLAPVAHPPLQRHFELITRAPLVAVASVPRAPPLRHHAPRGPPSLA